MRGYDDDGGDDDGSGGIIKMVFLATVIAMTNHFAATGLVTLFKMMP